MRNCDVFIQLCAVLALTFLALVLGALLYLLREASLFQRKLIQQQETRLKDLTNLAAAKDLVTFRELQHIQSSESPNQMTAFSTGVDPSFTPLDDIAMVKRLAANYSQHGMDPSQAFANDPLEEFGGIGMMLP
jgi:hypothetical protein